MSHFEYVSVAVALLYSLGIGKLLTGIPHIANRERGSAVVLFWVLALLLGSFASWWAIWRYAEVEWTALRFAVILGNPIIFYSQAAVLVSDNPAEVASWEDYYSKASGKFLGIFIANAFFISILSWTLGREPWFSLTGAHVAAPLIITVGLVALRFPSRRIHLGLAITMTVLAVLSLFLVQVD